MRHSETMSGKSDQTDIRLNLSKTPIYWASWGTGLRPDKSGGGGKSNR